MVGAAVPAVAQTPSQGDRDAHLATLGVTDIALEDDFEGDQQWSTAPAPQGTIEYLDGALVFTPQPSKLRWNTLTFTGPAPVFATVASVDLAEGSGSAGPMCGVSGTAPRYYYGTISTTGDAAIGIITDSRPQDLVKSAMSERVGHVPGQAPRLRIECATDGAGADRVALWVDGTLVADVVSGEQMGRFDTVGLLAEGGSDGWTATFDDVAVWSGDYAPRSTVGTDTSARTATLLSQVPDELRASCLAVSPGLTRGMVDAVHCTAPGTSEVAEYYRFGSLASMQAAFEAFLDGDAPGLAGPTCSVGPARTSYTIGDITAGEIACYADPLSGGARIVWTGRDLLVIGSAVESSGSYEVLQEWWTGAGPWF